MQYFAVIPYACRLAQYFAARSTTGLSYCNLLHNSACATIFVDFWLVVLQHLIGRVAVADKVWSWSVLSQIDLTILRITRLISTCLSAGPGGCSNLANASYCCAVDIVSIVPANLRRCACSLGHVVSHSTACHRAHQTCIMMIAQSMAA